MHSASILYSKFTDGYYVGSTSGPAEEMLKKHNSKHKGYTSRGKDWELIYEEQYVE